LAAPTNKKPSLRGAVVLAWATTLLVSTLPDIIWRELGRVPPPHLIWVKVALLLIVLGVATAWKPGRPLRGYLTMLGTLLVFGTVLQNLGEMSAWENRFAGSFQSTMLGTQLLRVALALIMIMVLLALGYRRRQCFLTRGDLKAPAGRVRWLGIDESTPWHHLAPIAAVLIGLGTLTFLVIATRPGLSMIGRVLPVLPAVLLLAAMNAFGEEVSYRAALLAPLGQAIGNTHALMLTAVFFGIGHYYGVPYGVIGVVMATFLGWFMGKAMLETRGFLWPWFIHFVQDVLIFSFMAAGIIGNG
jgi:membrane protease YdiL (CAAX protease family)